MWLCIRLPTLVREALAASEREALERLAAWAYQWTSRVSYRLSSEAPEESLLPAAPLLWLELGASRALFGEPDQILARIEQDLTELGYSYACALAPSPTGAALLASAASSGRAASLDDAGVWPMAHTRAQLRTRVAPLPLSLLELPATMLMALHSAGLRRIGEVLALPAASLARRFGPQMSLYLARLTGDVSDPRPTWLPPPVYRARWAFPRELHETGMLLFALQRLLLEFQGYLRARDCAVLRFTLELEHPRRPATQLTIGLSAPTRAAAQFLLLARERLHDLALSAPVCALAVTAHEFTAAAISQLDGFRSHTEQLDEIGPLVDRLRARLGDPAVQSLRSQADHRPERAWRACAPGPMRSSAASTVAAAAPSPSNTIALRPCALLANPQPLAAEPQLLRGPERIESGWWDGADAVRDYYLAAAHGARLWVYRDLREDRWYLHGLWV